MSIPPHLCTDGLPKSKRLWSEKEHFNCKMVLASIKEKSTVSDRSRINPLGTHIAKKSIPFKAISKIFKKEMIATKFTTHKRWSAVIYLPLVTPKRTAKNNCLKKNKYVSTQFAIVWANACPKFTPPVETMLYLLKQLATPFEATRNDTHL